MTSRIDPFKWCYSRQRNRALVRGIDWQFDLETWRALWLASGHWEERGAGRGRYCMARNGDVGPYAPDNVRIVTNEANAREWHINHPKTTAEMVASRVGRGRGWTFAKNGYQVTVSRKYIGRYRTQDEAEKAYARACAARATALVCAPDLAVEVIARLHGAQL